MTIAATCPAAIIIGRVAIYTRNRFLAREIEQQLVEQDALSRMTSGVTVADGKSVFWVVLPALNKLKGGG